MFGIGIQPREVQCESPFIGVGFGHEVHLAPLGGLRLLYDTKLESELQLVFRKNDVAVAGGATDASTSADRPLSPSDRRLPDVALLMLRRRL